MNWFGIIVAVVAFLCIGIFHPIVIKSEYYFGSKCWPAFLVCGILFLVLSVLFKNLTASIVMGILGCSCLWSILELKEQEKRVEKGWFPKRNITDRDTK